MVADLAASAYLVDGVDLAGTGVKLTHDGSGLWAGLTETLSLSTFPGIDGGHIDGGLFQPYTHSTMYEVRAAGFNAVWAAVVALRRRCKPGRTVTLTRLMPDPDGTDANTSHTTTARRLVDRPEWLGRSGALLDTDWQILEPWHGPAVTVPVSGTQTILGDTRTSRMTITLPAGPARYVVNNTSGNWLLFYAVVPTGGVVIDVEARTATAVTGGADLSSNLSWGGATPMQLLPGPNALSVTDGSASISYQPAYL